MNDLRFALRQLAKSPGFTTVAVLTLALGIGACAAIFSVMNGVLLRPLPFPQPESLVVIHEKSLTAEQTTVATGKYIAWKEQSGSFENMGALFGQSYNLTGSGDAVHLIGGRITSSLLPTLRLSPALGRNFLPEEELASGQENVAILSHGLWQARFGRRADVLNQTIVLSGRPFTIVGVMPPETGLPEPVKIFTPLGFSEGDRRNLGSPYLHVVGRLQPGRTVSEAQSEMAVVIERIARAVGAPSPGSRGWGVKVTPLIESIVGNVRPVLLALLGAVGFLLLIACANVAGLLLARATARAREIAVRAALGASRARIVRQLLVESAVLAFLGGALGLLLAEGGLSALLALAPDTLPRVDRIAIDPRAVAVTLAIALTSALGFGLVPAFRASRVQLSDTLKHSERAGGAGSRQRLRSALVMGEVAIALVLLAGAGLLMRSFLRLQELSPGFNPRDAHVADIFLPRPQYLTHAQYVTFAGQVMAEVAALPEVQAVAVANNLPFSNHHFTFGMLAPLSVPGRPPETGSEVTLANDANVSPDYFRAMGIPLLAGRPFDGRDVADAAPVVVISQSVARRLFPGENAVGKSIRAFGGPPRQIIGIAGDVKQTTLLSAGGLQVYRPFLQESDNDMIFVVRTSGPAGLRTAPAALRRAIARVDPKVPIYNDRPLTAMIGSSIARQQFSMTIFGVFSAVALVLAAIGIYGVMAYSVARRTGEIGVRMALGAQPSDVLRLVLAQGGRLVAFGVLAGVAGALALTRFLENLVFETRTHDPLTYVVTVVLLIVVAGTACLLPARRATKVSPMTALRSD